MTTKTEIKLYDITDMTDAEIDDLLGVKRPFDPLQALLAGMHNPQRTEEEEGWIERGLDPDMPCKKCGGTGYLPQYQHICGGECFRCCGTGKEAYYLSA